MEQFHEGNRVRTRVARHGLQVGVTGTIRRVFQSASDMYDVQLDDMPLPMLLHGSALELAEDEHPTSS